MIIDSIFSGMALPQGSGYPHSYPLQERIAIRSYPSAYSNKCFYP